MYEHEVIKLTAELNHKSTKDVSVYFDVNGDAIINTDYEFDFDGEGDLEIALEEMEMVVLKINSYNLKV